MEQDKNSASEHDRKLMNSYESPRADAETEKPKETKKKKRHLSLVQAPVEAEAARKTEQAAGKPKAPEQQLVPPKPAEEEPATTESTPARPRLTIVPGLKPPETTAPEAPESAAAKPEAETPAKAEATPDKPESAEAKDTTETLDQEEAPAVLEEYIAATKPGLEEELAELPPESEEIPEVVANVVFLDELRKAANQGEPLDEAAIDSALEQTAQVLELRPPTPEDAELPPEDELADEPEEIELETSEVSPPPSEAAETRSLDTEPTPLQSVTPTAVSAAVPPAPPSAAGPPGGQLQTFNRLANPGLYNLKPGGPGGPGGPSNPNALGAAANALPNVLKPASGLFERKARRKRLRNAALIAGVAYLVGRRHGRIHEQERHKPEHRKLERQVKDLQDKVALGEARARKLAARTVEQDPAAAQAIAEKKDTIKPFFARIERPAPPLATAETTLPRPEAFDQAERAEDVAEAPAYREREILYAPRQPEKLGKLAVTTPEQPEDLAPFAAAESVAQAYEAPPSTPEAKPATSDTLSAPQLLEVASHITVGGVSAEQLYRAERLDAEGLRKVVTEYVRGGNPEQVLNQQLKQVELKRSQSMEYLKPSAVQDASSPRGGGGGAAPADPRPSAPANPLMPLPPSGGSPSPQPPSTPFELHTQASEKKSPSTAQVATIAAVGGAGTILLLLFLL